MKKKLSFLIALVVAISLCVAPAVAQAATGLPYAITWGPTGIVSPGAANSVDVVVADTGDGWLQWTYTYSASPTHTPKMTVAIDYPAGFCITTFDDGSHDGWYYAPDGGTAVKFAAYSGGAYSDWAVTTAVGNVLTVRIQKSTLGLSFMWHGYANVDGAQVWIEMNTGVSPWAPTGAITIDADMGPSLTGVTPTIIAINVYPTSIDFGTITPGTDVSGDNITVTNIGTVAVALSAGIVPTSGAFYYLFLNDVQRTNGLWSASQLGLGTILPTLDVDCTTELKVPVTYSARGVENTQLTFIATPVSIP